MALLGTACSSAPSWLPGRNTETVEPVSVEDSEISLYLRNMHQLATAVADDQRKIFAALERKAERSPTTTNRLTLALARITSGHPDTDVATGRTQLQTLLNEPGLLVETERQLVIVFLNELDQRDRVNGDAERRLSESLRETERTRDQLARQLAAANSNNARLETQLREAEEKLSAITRIERSIRERTDDDPTQ